MNQALAFPGTADTLGEIARLIQLSLTPVFLLSSLAALLSVFATRLARVADRVDQIVGLLEDAGPRQFQHLVAELAYQRRRTRALDVAVVLATIGGILTCTSVLVMFIGALFGLNMARLLFTLFGGAIAVAIGALAAFAYEMLLASTGVRRKSRDGPSDATADRTAAAPPIRHRRSED